jgi:hypothetical protein
MIRHLKGRIVEPEETTVTRQQVNKHVSAATDTQETIGTADTGVIYALRAEAML